MHYVKNNQGDELFVVSGVPKENTAEAFEELFVAEKEFFKDQKEAQEKSGQPQPYTVICPECKGTGGKLIDGDCSDCNGKGYHWEPA